MCVDVMGRGECCYQNKVQRNSKSSQDASGIIKRGRETEVRKNLEASPEMYFLSPTFQNGVLTLRNKYRNELSILCGSQGI